MEDKYPEVVNFKKMGESLKKILGDQCEANDRVDEQVKDFMGCWWTLADDIQEKIRKVSRIWKTVLVIQNLVPNLYV